MKSKLMEDTVTTLTTTAISVKPAYDYHKPEWKFPAEGKIVTIGYDHLGLTLMNAFGNRVRFWSAGSIGRKADIPAKTSVILASERIKRDAQEYRLLNDCARSFGVPLFTIADELLDHELRYILRGADLSVDPDRIEPDPSSLTPAEPTAAPNGEWMPPKKGGVKAFFREHVNFDAGSRSKEAKRLRALIAELHHYEMTESAAYQAVLTVWPKPEGEMREPKSRAVDSRFSAGAIRVAVERVKLEFAAYVEALSKKLDELVEKAEQLDATNQTLATELEQERAMSTVLRARQGEFEALAAAVERIKRK